MPRSMSDIGEAALLSREANKTKAYKDSVGVWTIGVGHTAGAGEPIPRAGMQVRQRGVETSAAWHGATAYMRSRVCGGLQGRAHA